MNTSIYFGGDRFLDKLIFHYRYIIICYFMSIFFWLNCRNDIFGTATILAFFLIINVVYFLYVLLIQLLKVRERYSCLKHRVIRINLDLLYFTACLFLIGNTPYPFFLIYLLPLLSAINYRKNRYFGICSIWLSSYFALLQLLFAASKQINWSIVPTKVGVFTAFALSFSAILYVYDKRYVKKEAQLDGMMRFVQNVRYSDNYREALENLVDELRKLTKVPIITIMLYEQETNELFIAYSFGITDDQKTLRLKPGQGVCGYTFKNKKYTFVRDTTDEKRNCGYIAFKNIEKPVLSELCFPLILPNSDTVIGVLNFEAYEKDFFEDELIYVIETSLHHIVFTLEKALQDYKYNLVFRRRIDAFRENVLFLREIAHEWRNALTTFVQFPDYILNKNGKDYKVIRDLARQQNSEMDPIEKHLKKALESKTIYKPDLQKINIPSILDKVTNDNHYRLVKRNVTLEKETFFEGDLETDLEWIRSIFNNLVTNSIESYERNKIGERIITIEVHLADSNVGFVLSDRAGGIDARLAKKVSDPSVLEVHPGRLGLNLVKKYTLLLGGRIECEILEDPPGTRFMLTFPTTLTKKE